MTKIEDCGKYSVLLKPKEDDSKGYLAVMASCKNPGCPKCSQIITEYLKQEIAYYAVEKDLHYFATFTVGTDDVDDLLNRFARLIDDLNLFNKEVFAAKYYSREENEKKALEEMELSYYNFVNKYFKDEHYYRWLYGKDMTPDEREKGYVPLSQMGYDITEYLELKPSQIKKKCITPLLHWKTKKKGKWLEKAVDDYYEVNIKPYVKKWKGKKYIETKNNRKDFLNDFNVWMEDETKKRFDESVEVKIDYSESLKKDVKVSFIRTLEFHKKHKDFPHLHSLVNQYIPFALVKKHFAGKVYLVEDLKQNHDTTYSDFDSYVAAYLSKYVSKETMEILNNSNEDFSYKVVSASNDISIQIENAFSPEEEGKYILVETRKGVLPRGSMQYHSIDEFKKDLKPIKKEIHSNPYIEKNRQYLIEYSQKMKNLSNIYEKGSKKYRNEVKKLKTSKDEFVKQNNLNGFLFEIERRNGIKYPALKIKEKKEKKSMETKSELKQRCSHALREYRASGFDLELGLQLALGLDFDLDFKLALALAFDFELELKLALALGFDLDLALDLELELGFDLGLDLELGFGGLSKEQLYAINSILRGGFVNFLVGYAGCGKTHTLNKLLSCIDTKKEKVAICSYTGKAVSRIKENMKQQKIEDEDIEIGTIHSLAGAEMSDIPYPIFYNDSNNPLDFDVVIFDEFSMISLDVLVNFLAALKPNTKLIFVGDTGQLNPVGSNHPLYYFKNFTSLEIPVYELTKNFRSDDVVNSIANSIRKGNLDGLKMDSFELSKVSELVGEGYQFLCNSRNLAKEINLKVQESKEDICLNYKYAIGDRAMITKNDKRKRYFNGDFVVITRYDEILERVYFKLENSEEELYMTRSQANERIVPAFAITIHKSQGSEFEKVAIVLDLKKEFLTNRNLLYTAITRAKKEFKVFSSVNMITTEMLDSLSREQKNDD